MGYNITKMYMYDTEERIIAAAISTKQTINDSVFTNLSGDFKYLFQLYQFIHPQDTDIRALEYLVNTYR